MPKAYHFTKLSNPAGQTQRSWRQDIATIKSKGWLVDPGPLPDDPMRARCLSVCRRPRCKRAGRCKFVMPLALREHCHLLYKGITYAEYQDTDLRPVFTKADVLWNQRKSPLARKRGEPRVKPKLTIP